MPVQNKDKTSPKRNTPNIEKETPQDPTAKKGTTYRDPDAPPNDHVRKDPDEVYGDTTIPQRGSK